MKYLFAFAAGLLCNAYVIAQTTDQFTFISPVPGSKFHNPAASIILRASSAVVEGSLVAARDFEITGSHSGRHSFELQLIQEGRTILLQPETIFSEGEAVTVTVKNPLRLKSGNIISPSAFQFYIRAPRTSEQQQRMAQQMQNLYSEEGIQSLKPPPTKGLPEYTILTNTTTSPGHIFFSDFNFYLSDEAYYCIIGNNGDSVFGKLDTVTFNNFDLNRNGYLTAYNDQDSTFVMLDSNYTAEGVYQMGNGYVADVHEFLIFPDGRHFMMCYDPQIVDMTVYNPSYNPEATVVGCVIQELDAQKNVLFEWRTWDHIDILDADHVNFASAFIDAVHSNAIEVDIDGNILLTSRHLSEVTKINRETGNIIWRMGGGNVNDFTFINDDQKFSYPHDARRLANGNLLIFDNGNYHSPKVSAAKEYEVDEVYKTATLVWSFKRNTDQGDIYAAAMGSVQRLDNGNTLITWGLVNGMPDVPKITEVDSNGNIVWEMQLGDNDAVYRAHRYEWFPCSRPSNAFVKVSNITSSKAKLSWKPGTNASSYDVQYRKVGDSTWIAKNFKTTSVTVKNLAPNTKYEFQVRSKCTAVPTPYSGWSNLKKFKTLPLRLEEEQVEVNSVRLFPNPAGDFLQVSFSERQEDEFTATVFDSFGRIVWMQAGISSAGNEIEISTKEWAAGFYYLEISSPSYRAVSKFVKQ